MFHVRWDNFDIVEKKMGFIYLFHQVAQKGNINEYVFLQVKTLWMPFNT